MAALAAMFVLEASWRTQSGTIAAMAWQLWLAFFAAAWAISLSPGPGAVAVMSASLQHGFARGWFAVVGLVLGFWTQLVVVAAGIGAIIATSALAFAVVKWLGVAYLVYLGIRQWRAPPLSLEPSTVGRGAPATRSRIVVEAWLLNAVNPKGTVFMLAVVPQFLVPSEPLVPQYVAIGATLAFTDLVVNTGYAALASRLLGLLRSPKRVRAVQRVFGSLFIALGALLATFKRV
jgi:homoserine/homoserine lactone efflux protein